MRAVISTRRDGDDLLVELSLPRRRTMEVAGLKKVAGHWEIVFLGHDGVEAQEDEALTRVIASLTKSIVAVLLEEP